MKEVTGKMAHRNNVSPINTEKVVNASNGGPISINIIKTNESHSNNNSPLNKDRVTPTKFAKI